MKYIFLNTLRTEAKETKSTDKTITKACMLMQCRFKFKKGKYW